MTTRKEQRKGHTKGELIKMVKHQNDIIMNQHTYIQALEHQIYMQDLYNNPCHEAQRLQYGWSHPKTDNVEEM